MLPFPLHRKFARRLQHRAVPSAPSGGVLRCGHVFAPLVFQAGYKPAGRTDLKGLCSNQRLRFLIIYSRHEIGNAAAEIRRQRTHGIGFRPTRLAKMPMPLALAAQKSRVHVSPRARRYGLNCSFSLGQQRATF